jgi:hypothetical protein
MTSLGLYARKKPAVIGDGRPGFGVQQVLRPLHHATLTGLDAVEGVQKPEQVT